MRLEFVSCHRPSIQRCRMTIVEHNGTLELDPRRYHDVIARQHVNHPEKHMYVPCSTLTPPTEKLLQVQVLACPKLNTALLTRISKEKKMLIHIRAVRPMHFHLVI